MVFMFYGPNSYAARHKLRELVERFKKSSGSDFGLERIDGETATAEQVVGSITALPFLGSNRLVILEDILANKQLAEAVLAALNRVPDSNVVVIYERKPDERTKAFKDLVKATTAKKFELLDDAKLVQWVRKTVQNEGGSVEPLAARYLAERAGNDQWKLHQEITKLLSFSSEITQASIDELVEPVFEQTIFDLLEAVSAGELKQALKLYKGLRANKAEPVYILSMLGWQLHNVLVVVAAAGKSSTEVGKDFGMRPFVINKTRRLAGRLGLETLQVAYDSLVETDLKLKTSAGEPDLLLEEFIINLSRLLSPAEISN